MNKFVMITKPLTWFISLLLIAVAAGCNSGSDPILSGNFAYPSAKAITAYSLVGVTGTINEPAKTIEVTVPYGTNVTALVATFTSTGVSVKVGSTVQTSTATANNFSSPVLYTVTAADTSTAIYTVTVTVAPNTAKAITSYSFAGYTGAAGVINEPAKTIEVTVPYGTDVTSLVATFTTTGVNVKVGSTVQASAATANNFSSPVDYIVTAANNTTATYTVTVTVAPNTAKAITAYSFAGYTGAAGVINEPAKTIAVTVPFGTDVTGLVATFTTTGVSVKVGSTFQTSTATANNFSSPVDYTVTAANLTTATYTVTVTVAPNTAKAITSYSFAGYTGAAGVINEPAKTIAVTVPFGTDVTSLAATFVTTGVSVKVGSTFQTSTATANNFSSPVAYTVTAANNTTATYLVTVTIAPSTAKAITSYSFAGYTGATGIINEPAKTIAVTVPFGTDVTGLVATFTTTGVNVKVGAAIQTSTATANNFSSPVAYIVTAADTNTATYLVTVTIAPNTAKAITSYSFAGYTGATGIINEPAKTIAVTVPFGTDVTTMVATFTTTGVNVKVGAAIQTSTATANNFSSPVPYTVTAADTSTAIYTVTVTVAPNTAKAITSYSFAGYTGAAGVINESAKTIAVTVPFGTDVTGLVATFATTGVNVKVGSTVQTSAATANNFSSPVAYTVTADDTSTAIYTVTVSIAPNTAKAITAYSFAGYTGAAGVINEPAKTIAVTVPFGTDVTGLVATFTTTGVNVKVGSTVQTSAATANNFSSPVLYTVTAADTSTVIYTVTVTVAPNTAKAITSYSFAGYTGAAGVINEPAKTIAVTVPIGTDVTGLVATFTTTGVNVKVGSTVQTSTATANDFSSPVAYTVTAADTSTATYTVTVTVSGLNLRRTASFAVLAGSSISNAGLTTVTGDVGATGVTGTAPAVTGNYYPLGSEAAYADAIADLPLVISDANSAVLFPCDASISGAIGTQSLAPGVYCISSDAAISGVVNLTLNGAGDYYFRTNGALTPAATSTVVFGGTATDANTNVFWVVGSANLGTPATWKGTILSGGAVTLGNNDTLEKGRVLSNAAVTLSNNTITIP